MWNLTWGLKTQTAIAIIVSVSIAASAWWLHSRGVQAGRTQVQALWDAESARVAQAQAIEIIEAMATSAALQAKIDQLQRSHHSEITRISRRHAALVASLRDRPEARAADPRDLPADPAVRVELAIGCTGAQLSKPDARFLAGEAALAAELQAALRACLFAYEEVRVAADPGAIKH